MRFKRSLIPLSPKYPDDTPATLIPGCLRHRYNSADDRPATPTCSRPKPVYLVVDNNAVDRLNRIDEAIALATLPAYKPVVRAR